MHYQMLRAEIKDGVMVVRLVRPAKVDSLTDELYDVCEEILSNREIRVAVLDGIGEDFSGAEGIKSEGTYRSMVEPIAGLDLPVIGVIEEAVGLGLELALACDIRICTESSHFGFFHIQEGLIPWDGGTQRLPRLVGRSKALEMILTGVRIDAREAQRIGLVNRVVSTKDLIPAAMKMAQEMATKAPYSLKYAKEAICKGMDLTLDQGLRLEGDLYFLLHTTKDREEGIKAFREKKTPKFKGK